MSDIVSALTVSEDDGNLMDTTDRLDASIGSTTLLDAFQGLSHNDIITLTLTNVCEGSQDLGLPNLNEIPDSSSTVMGCGTGQGAHVESAITSNSSDPEPMDDSFSDPTFVPRATRGRGRGKAHTTPETPKAATSETAPHVSPPASSEASSGICSKPSDTATQQSTEPVQTTKPASPVSLTEALPPSTSHISPTKATGLTQNARWSFLLSKHPMKQFHASTSNLPKPQLRVEESLGVPPKAAEMYVAFGAKSSNAQSSLPSASPADFTQAVTPHHQNSSSSSSLLAARTSKVPPGPDAVRYKVRYKLMKKLKAKKKELAKLDKLLGRTGEASLQPDSTNLSSPVTVTSSTYDGSTCDDFLSDLLSPATTASNLSPDSTGLQEVLAGGQAALEQLDCGASAAVAGSRTDTFALEPNYENFLDEFLSQAVTQTPTDMESEALSELGMFM